MKYAVIGTSGIAKEFVAAAEGSGLVLVGVCSRSAGRGAAFADEIGQPGLPVFVGLDALAAAQDIDAVYVASPNICHFEQCKKILQTGKHVLCEKPLTLSPHQLTELQSLAAEQGLILMEAIMYLHTPMRHAVWEALPCLGRIRSVQIDFSQRSSRLNRLLAGEMPNVFNPTLGGGALNDLGVYCVYPLLDFFGEPEAVIASHLRYDSPGAADTSGTALLHYRDFDAALSWSKAGQSRGVSQIIGENGTLSIGSISQFQGVTLYDREGNATLLNDPMSKVEVMRYEAAAFYRQCHSQTNEVSYETASELALRVNRWMENIRLGNAL